MRHFDQKLAGLVFFNLLCTNLIDCVVNLIIDRGNTLTKVAVFKEDTLVESFIYDNFGVEACTVLLVRFSVKNGVLCEVAKSSEELLEYMDNNIPNFLFIDENTTLPIKNRYRTPKTLGKDRIAAAVGGNWLFPNSNLLIVDIGTAITYEFVNKDANYLGGNISPGLSMRFKALNAFTDRLPLVDYRGELLLVGEDTDTAIRAGVVYGVVLEIRGFIELMRNKYSDLEILFTGGHAKYIESLMGFPVKIDINLVLKGLNRILNYNVEK